MKGFKSLWVQQQNVSAGPSFNDAWQRYCWEDHRVPAAWPQ
jgi:hypothetical protein